MLPHCLQTPGSWRVLLGKLTAGAFISPGGRPALRSSVYRPRAAPGQGPSCWSPKESKAHLAPPSRSWGWGQIGPRWLHRISPPPCTPHLHREAEGGPTQVPELAPSHGLERASWTCLLSTGGAGSGPPPGQAKGALDGGCQLTRAPMGFGAELRVMIPFVSLVLSACPHLVPA